MVLQRRTKVWLVDELLSRSPQTGVDCGSHGCDVSIYLHASCGNRSAVGFGGIFFETISARATTIMYFHFELWRQFESPRDVHGVD